MAKRSLRLFFLMLFSLSTKMLFAQTYIPKESTIILVKEEIVTDSVAFKRTSKIFIENFFAGLKGKIIAESEAANEQVDTLFINETIGAVKGFLAETLNQPIKKIKMVVEYKDGKIFYSQLTGNGKNNTLYYYDSFTNTVVNNYNQSPLSDYFEQEQIISVSEHKNEKKSIQGYNCFKVVYKYMEKSENEEIFMPPIVYTRELWVTEQLRFPFHPTVKSNKIIAKYYPLHIIESIDGITGKETVYTVEAISFRRN